jgi:hypothetical protein
MRRFAVEALPALVVLAADGALLTAGDSPSSQPVHSHGLPAFSASHSVRSHNTAPWRHNTAP